MSDDFTHDEEHLGNAQARDTLFSVNVAAEYAGTAYFRLFILRSIIRLVIRSEEPTTAELEKKYTILCI